MNDAIYLGFTTCHNQDLADRLALDLIERKLAVSVQRESIHSTYFANDGELKSHGELRMTIKFLESHMAAIDAYMLANHNDELGEWCSLKIDRVSNKYLQWAMSR